MYATKLYKNLVKPGEELFFSPASIQSAMTLVALGGAGTTRDEIAQAFGLPSSDAGIVQMLALAAQPSSDVEWAFANRVFGEGSYPFKTEFLRIMNSLGGFQAVDFARNAEGERQVINSWVEQQTKDRIKDLIPAGVLNSLTRAVLVNAVYFLAKWNSRFDIANTHLAHFQNMGPIPMMYQEHPFLYAKPCAADVVHRIWLPYVGEQYGMQIIMPNDGYTLENAERTVEIAGGWHQMLPTDMYNVKLWMPKWEQTWGTFDIIPALRALGIQEAFGDEADFSGMTPVKGDVYISHVLHQAYIRVDEAGTEAAAATAAIAKGRGIAPEPPKTVELRLNRPFLYAIMRRNERNPLFVGRVFNPKAPKA